VSDPYGLLVVGGGPAGFAAARGYRQAGGDGEVAIVSDEGRMPYERPPLTKEFLRGEASEADLPIEEEEWLDRKHVALIGGRAVTLDPDARIVTLSGGRRLRYRECVLATGGEPTRLPIPGSDHPRVRVVRTLDHVRDLIASLAGGTSVVVIGSGFIGCEIASSLRIRGHAVTVVSNETTPNAARLGDDAAARLRDWLEDDGVELCLGCAAERIEPVGGGVEVHAGDRRVAGRLAVMAAGVSPRAELALQAGLTLEDGAIPVSAAMRSERDGLLAAGDACKADNVRAGRSLRVEHWGDALSQGEIAGASAAGAEAQWDEVPGFWSTIGRRTLKYAAWGDGYDESDLRSHDDGGFTARYGRDGKLVGILAHEADDDYERGREQIARGDGWRS
jgi:3-phenylpropionate/trans-cinnamate dioxygenase ferredoxin reductase subunit